MNYQERNNTEYFLSVRQNNDGKVYVGKYKKGDSLILKDSEAKMYIIDNKLFELTEKRTEINLIKIE